MKYQPLVKIVTLLKIWAWLIIPGLLIIEYVVIFLQNPEYQREITEAQSNVEERSASFRNHALTLAGMAFTVTALLIALDENPERFVDTLKVLGMAIALLFFSYEVKELSRTREYWYTLQEKTLSYGFLSLFLAVVLLFDVTIPGNPWLLLGGFILVALIRYSTVVRQGRMLQRMREKGEIEEQEGLEERSRILNIHLAVIVFFAGSLVLGDYGNQFLVKVLEVSLHHRLVAGFIEPFLTKLLPAMAVLALLKWQDVSADFVRQHPYWLAGLGGFSVGVFERVLVFWQRGASISPGFVLAGLLHVLTGLLVAGVIFATPEDEMDWRFWVKLIMLSVVAVVIHVGWNGWVAIWFVDNVSWPAVRWPFGLSF